VNRCSCEHGYIDTGLHGYKYTLKILVDILVVLWYTYCNNGGFIMKKWNGTWPTTCDMCGAYLPDEKYFCDARCNDGRWGLFCPTCHRDYCFGRLGVGSGQKYNSKTLEKIEVSGVA
jgi:hypothetical protein